MSEYTAKERAQEAQERSKQELGKSYFNLTQEEKDFFELSFDDCYEAMASISSDSEASLLHATEVLGHPIHRDGYIPPEIAHDMQVSVASDATTAYYYALESLQMPWHKVEDLDEQYSNLAESTIASAPYRSLDYADAMEMRWEKSESQRKTIEQALESITSNAEVAYAYARDVLQCRWDEAEGVSEAVVKNAQKTIGEEPLLSGYYENGFHSPLDMEKKDDREQFGKEFRNACWSGELGKVKAMMIEYLSFNMPFDDEYGQTFVGTTERGQIDVAKYLYNETRACDASIPINYLNEAFVGAASNGHPEVVDWLLSLDDGIDINHKDGQALLNATMASDKTNDTSIEHKYTGVLNSVIKHAERRDVEIDKTYMSEQQERVYRRAEQAMYKKSAIHGVRREKVKDCLSQEQGVRMRESKNGTAFELDDGQTVMLTRNPNANEPAIQLVDADGDQRQSFSTYPEFQTFCADRGLEQEAIKH